MSKLKLPDLLPPRPVPWPEATVADVRKWTRCLWETFYVFHPEDGGCLRMEVWFGPGPAVARVVDINTSQVLWSRYWRWDVWERSTTTERFEMAKSIFQRIAEAQKQDKKSAQVVEKAAKDRWPNIIDLMTTTALPGGQVRTASRLSVAWEEGVWKAGITDPDGEMSAWASSPALEALWDVLEARLASDDPEVWRKWGSGFKGPLKGRRKG